MRFLQLTSIIGLLIQAQQTLSLTNPIRENPAEPDIFYDDGHYYMTYTSGDRIENTRASVIEDLRRGETKTIWTDSNEGRNDAMWAPEVHRVDGAWGGSIWSASRTGTVCPAIAKLDTKNWTVDQWHVISSPDQPWEKKMGGGKSGLGINEAPFPLYHGDDIWITFSASHCKDPGYSLSLLKLNGGDPLQKTSWDKSGPIVSAAGGNYGVGHNAFFPLARREASLDLFEKNLFHATKKSEGNCGPDRFAMIQQVIFDKDGNPSFDQPGALDAETAPPSGQ
ncbi:unnamed protein product [Clonostachys rhizophaga]|uniref:Glycoside hydrolase family 43 protein n=1 Tax=Clonostachys rhizophaga TaxID=160324 RepID=A0A9N9VEA8_9HYPO|nr:unnamed protein product [Clonostachys rhizophaga]